jgi:hypothetical protein
LALGVFFIVGVIFRGLELYPQLRFMPMRLFPVFTPLFFIFTAFYIVPKIASRERKIAAAAFALVVIALLNPFGKGMAQIRETVRSREAQRDDFQKAAIWISENTPEDALVIEPPSRRDVWYFSKRATIASYYYPPYDRLAAWRARLAELSNNVQVSGGDAAAGELETAFDKLAETQIEQLKEKYGASFLVSRGIYSYPVVFETGTYKIYQLKIAEH